MELDTIKQTEIKENTTKEQEYLSKPSLQNKSHQRNTLAVPLLRYSGSFVKLSIVSLRQIDQRTRNLMTMHQILLLEIS